MIISHYRKTPWTPSSFQQSWQISSFEWNITLKYLYFLILDWEAFVPYEQNIFIWSHAAQLSRPKFLTVSEDLYWFTVSWEAKSFSVIDISKFTASFDTDRRTWHDVIERRRIEPRIEPNQVIRILRLRCLKQRMSSTAVGVSSIFFAHWFRSNFRRALTRRGRIVLLSNRRYTYTINAVVYRPVVFEHYDRKINSMICVCGNRCRRAKVLP